MLVLQVTLVAVKLLEALLEVLVVAFEVANYSKQLFTHLLFEKLQKIMKRLIYLPVFKLAVQNIFFFFYELTANVWHIAHSMKFKFKHALPCLLDQ